MLTLKKVKELVEAPSHAKRTPSPKMLFEEGIVLLRREFDQGSHTELRADQYAYRLLINLIMQQKKNEVPEELQVFWEDQYLSPIILFEMFRLFDVYSELKGKKIVYQDHPTPKERQDNIFSMFKDDIPEEMNTEEGNKVLNLILNSSEYAEDWLRYKISKGKL